MNITIDDYNIGEGEDNYMKFYTADFETTTDIDDCRVWAFSICDIDNPDDVIFGNSIEGFLDWCKENKRTRLYFHNLAFDGAFIIDYLEKHGWTWVNKREEYGINTYTTLISDMNLVYNIKLYFNKNDCVSLYDSYKIIPLSVADMAKAYKLEQSKLTLDYETYREVGHELTEHEKEYIKADVQIVAKVLKLFIEDNLSRMTAGSNALYDFKQILGGAKSFRSIYPYITKEEDDFMRDAYRGGFTYVNPRYANKELGDGIVLDVNSLYPSVMFKEALPYDKPIWFSGKYDESNKEKYPLWIASVSCYFELKEGYIPTIQLKGNRMFMPNEYITDSGTVITMCVTNVDWELIVKHYNVSAVRWHGGYMFKASNFFFKPYINKWIKIKNKSTIEGNSGRRQIAKLMLNSLYGKFATRMEVISRKPVLVDNVIKYVDLEPEEKQGVYLPVGIFITSYARYKTITSAQSVYDRFIYADTDSLHLLGTDFPENLEIDDVKLGAWKVETIFDRAKFLRQKCYIEHEKDAEKITVHVAGMPKNVHSQVTFENFKLGAEYQGKLYQKRVNGGIVLMPDKMVIRNTLL